MKFGENLKTLRKNSKISQEELADKIGVTRQSVSKWEVGDAYPEMSNIVALCSIFHCNINDLINDNTLDVDSFDKDTKEGIVKFKKEQQKRMKVISKVIFILAKIVSIFILIPTVMLILASLIFPFFARMCDITEDKIVLLNKEYNYSIDNNKLTIDDTEINIDTGTDLKEFVSKHDRKFFIISVEYILICFAVLSSLTVLTLRFISKLYKNIYNSNTPFTIENERIVFNICLFFILEMFLQKGTAYIYSFIADLDLGIDLNIKDLIVILIGVSIVYLFKYGRMLQADSKAKIYD